MALIPPDVERCQAEVPNRHSFMTFGGAPGRRRCTNRPIVVAEDTIPGEDGHNGSMSLCLECLCVMSAQERQLWTRIVLTRIDNSA